jgi:hypothetical protein
MIMLYLHTEFQTSNSSSSLVISDKLKTFFLGMAAK